MFGQFLSSAGGVAPLAGGVGAVGASDDGGAVVSGVVGAGGMVLVLGTSVWADASEMPATVRKPDIPATARACGSLTFTGISFVRVWCTVTEALEPKGNM